MPQMFPSELEANEAEITESYGFAGSSMVTTVLAERLSKSITRGIERRWSLNKLF
jgi:hypothetical protein